MARRLLIALTLAGFVLSGISMSTHASSGGEPVDVVIAAAHVGSAGETSATADTVAAADASATTTRHHETVSAHPCVDCAPGMPVHDPAMLMALGCVFVAIAVAVTAIPLVRVMRSLRLLPRALPSSVGDGWLPRLTMALDPPDLLALGISRT